MKSYLNPCPSCNTFGTCEIIYNDRGEECGYVHNRKRQTIKKGDTLTIDVVPTEIKHEFTKKMVCPYCGMMQIDDCPELDNSGTCHCTCGNVFEFTRNVTFTTRKIETDEEREVSRMSEMGVENI